MVAKNMSSPKDAARCQFKNPPRRQISLRLYKRAAMLMIYFMAALITTVTSPLPVVAGTAAKIDNLHIPFIVNTGQVDGQVAYYANTFSGAVAITTHGDIVYSLPQYESGRIATGVTLRERIVGGTRGHIVGKEPATTQVNYFKGNDPSAWITGLATYNSVSLGEVYDGIELEMTVRGHNVEKLFTVHPGADPATIAIKVEGGSALSVDVDGALVVATGLGPVRFTRPIAYQPQTPDARPGELAPSRTEIAATYFVTGENYGFRLGEYDPSRAVIIDPLLASTFLGDVGVDLGFAIAHDSAGNIYIAGETNSVDFPFTPGVYSDEYMGGFRDAFVSRFNGNLSDLQISTFIGGTRRDAIYSLTIDEAGDIYIAGSTRSLDYPTTTAACDTTFNGGGWDGVVSKLSGDLTTLLSSTYLGGADGDYGHIVLLNTTGDVYISGETFSSNFPFSTGAYDTTHNGGSDVFVSRLDSELNVLQASTFLGGSANEGGNAFIMDSSGDVLVTGYIQSDDYPTTTGVLNELYNGGDFDTFIARLDSDLSSLVASSYLGSVGSEYSYAMALDSAGNVFIGGATDNLNFPTTTGVYDDSYSGNFDAYVAKLDANFTTLLASTFLGDVQEDVGTEILVRDNGDVYIGGNTFSTDFPTTSGAYDEDHNGDRDVFLTMLDNNLTNVSASTFIGGNDSDYLFSLGFDASGNVMIAGATASVDFPTSFLADDRSHNGSDDAFMSKFDSALSANIAAIDIQEQHGNHLRCSCYPNPFNHGTIFNYTLTQPGPIRLTVFNSAGRLVCRLIRGHKTVGLHEIRWDGRDDCGRVAASGTYYYRLETDHGATTKRVVLLK